MSSKLDKYREFRDVSTKNPVSEDVRYLYDRMMGNRKAGELAWDLSPDYQREHVWTTRQKELFLGHFIEGGFMQPIYVQRYESEHNFPQGGRDGWLDQPCEVIDGKQRLQALIDWVEGRVVAEVSCGDRIAWADLDKVDKRFLPDFKITYVDLSRKDRLRFYIKLNRGGSIHTDAEIEKVRDLLKAEEK